MVLYLFVDMVASYGLIDLFLVMMAIVVCQLMPELDAFSELRASDTSDFSNVRLSRCRVAAAHFRAESKELVSLERK